MREEVLFVQEDADVQADAENYPVFSASFAENYLVFSANFVYNYLVFSARSNKKCLI